jgi:hypothetical protein
LNSNHYNNNLDNLQILCPNCHAQIPRRGSTPSGERPDLESGEAERPIAGSTPASRTNHCDCGNIKGKKYKRCRKCADFNLRRIEWPDIRVLLDKLNESNYSRLSRELGVSDNAIRKHLKRYGNQ